MKYNKIDDKLCIDKDNNETVISLVGNPNVGKSSIFNILTGMNQHTGNWPGKTVDNAVGSYVYKDKKFTLVDLPGTYSLMANSKEEEITRDFICFSNSDLVLVVVDATNIKRNLNLLFQILEITSNVVLCVNLIDEAKKKKISISIDELEKILGIPVVATSTKKKIGINDIKEKIYNFNYNYKGYKVTYSKYIESEIKIIEEYIDNNYNFLLNSRFLALKFLDSDDVSIFSSLEKYCNYSISNDFNFINLVNNCRNNLELNGIKKHLFRDEIVCCIGDNISKIYNATVESKYDLDNNKDRFIDKILTNKFFSMIIMFLMLIGIFWITIVGSNYPSNMLSSLFSSLGNFLEQFLVHINVPSTIISFLISGIYTTVTWVIAVMLPPMVIFFPLFTLMEDLGFLPRIAFNVDNLFEKSGSNGKQALTMCMGFGCNSCGVVGTRIIESKKDRFLSIMTNNFVPCNGRFPTLISIITMFLVYNLGNSKLGYLTSAFILSIFILLGIIMTFIVTKLLSKYLFKDNDTHFILELPPYRKPNIISVIIRSIFDKVIFVLYRAVKVSVPAGIILWLCSNIFINNNSILSYFVNLLSPVGKIFGMDGVILVAFILGFPANEIVIPIMIMCYIGSKSLISIDNLNSLKSLLVSNGWTIKTAICTMIFCLFHYPCGTTMLTIKKETNDNFITLLSFVIPTIIGLLFCFLINILL